MQFVCVFFLGMDCFIDNDPIMKPQFSPESDNFQGDTTMMESPDSGYRSPQDFTSKLLTNHLGAYSSNGKWMIKTFINAKKNLL